MDQFSILNYQGSKKSLIEFIHTNVDKYINNDKAILDIFAGTCSVGYSYKSSHTVYANDSELYSYHISRALLSNGPQRPENEICEIINELASRNYKKLEMKLGAFNKEETYAIENQSVELLCSVYKKYPTIWNDTDYIIDTETYNLFTTYYAGTYFGIKQAFQIDSIRYAIEYYADTDLFSIMLSSLFYAMKESVFSKDGHMAQPLDPMKNSLKLIKKRQINIYELFWLKIHEFYSKEFIKTEKQNKIYNLNFCDLLKVKEISNNVGFIYADPPYTDMQYSRYYHLLNVVSKYDYPKPSLVRGKHTKGLYTIDRFQSDLSKKGSSLLQLKTLIEFAKNAKINLAISFAYPINPSKQKTDRYVMSIDQLKTACYEISGSANVDVVSVNYTHSNNRNKEVKNVNEYLIICKN